MRAFRAHGVGFSVRVHEGAPSAAGSEVLSWIGEDFAYFELGRPAAPAPTELEFVIGAPAARLRSDLGALPRAFRTRMCQAYGWGRTRACDYGEGVLAVSRMGPRHPRQPRRTLEISLGNGTPRAVSLAYEALYGAMLSALGESLDLRRYHRVHALALAKGRRTALVLLPTGAGKSAMAALLMGRPDFKIFSDESPLHHGGQLYPFPIRGALAPEVARALGLDAGAGRLFRRKHFGEKLLFPFAPGQVAGGPAPAEWILLGKRSASSRIRAEASPGPGRIGRIDRIQMRLAAMAGLLEASVVGRGLAQMSEYMIRGDSLWNLPAIAWDRLHSARKLLQTARLGWFEVSDNAHQNAQTLSDFLG